MCEIEHNLNMGPGIVKVIEWVLKFRYKNNISFMAEKEA